MKTKNTLLIASSIALTVSCNVIKDNSLDVEKVTIAEQKSPKTLQTIDLAFLNVKIAPQEDFFQFSNGTWIANNPVPPSESRWGSFNELELNNKLKLTQILENFKTLLAILKV